MNKTFTIIACLLALNISLTANTKTNKIRGQVIDAVNNYPLIGANIVLLNSNPIIGASTDANGLFTLDEVPVGRQSIQISYLGYKTKTMGGILVTSGKEVNLVILVDEDITQVEEIIVTSKAEKHKALNEMAMISARTFSVEETERFAGSLGDPAKMVSNYAGVSGSNDGRNDIIIRGNSPTGILWRIEDVEVPNPNHFGAVGTTGGSVGMINNNLLTNSDFLTGAFPAEYGNALAGAFDLNLRSGNSQNAEFVGQIGMGGFELGAEGPLFKTGSGQKASYIANVRVSTMEVMNAMGVDVGTGGSVPEYKDMTFVLDIPGTKAGRFKLFGLWGQSYIELGRNLEDTTETSYSTRGTGIDFGSGLYMAGLSHTYFFNSKTRIKTTVSYQSSFSNTKYDSLINDVFIPVNRAEEIEGKFAVSTNLKYKLNKKNNFTLGVKGDYFNFTYLDSTMDNDYQKFIINNDIQDNATLFQAYGEWQHKFENNMTTYVGLNTQSFSQSNETSIEPRLGLKWDFHSKHSINAGIGVHSQIQPKMVYFQETYNPTTDSYFRTNENLKSTKSNHYILGYNYLISENLNLKVEGYYQNLYNVPVKESFPELSMLNAGAGFGIFVVDSLVNEGTGQNYGIDLTFEKYLDKGFYFLITSSLYESKYQGYDKKTRNTAFNSNFSLNLLAGYEYAFNEKYMVTLDLRTVWAGGSRYIPIDLEASEEAQYPEYDWEHAFKERNPDYFRIDLRIGFKHNARKFSQEIGIDFQNLTNHQNLFMESYDAEKNEVYNVYQTGFYPMVLYRINF